SQLFEPIEANLEFLGIEWTPKSVCSQSPLLQSRMLGAKPIKDGADDDSDSDDDDDQQEGHKEVAEEVSQAPPGATDQPLPPVVDDTAEGEIDVLFSSPQYIGDKLLAMIIPPIAILIALLFAVTI